MPYIIAALVVLVLFAAVTLGGVFVFEHWRSFTLLEKAFVVLVVLGLIGGAVYVWGVIVALGQIQ